MLAAGVLAAGVCAPSAAALVPLPVSLGPLLQQGTIQQGTIQEATSQESVSEPVQVDLGPGQDPLEVTPGEELDYRIRLSVGSVDTEVGRARIETGFEPYRPPLFGASKDGAKGDVTWIRTTVRGGYQVYNVEQSIETRLQPSAWPRLLQRYDQTGTEQRRREVKIGIKDGRNLGELRSDTDDGAPTGGRIWRAPVTFEVPPGAVDSMAALYLSRRLVGSEAENIEFLMVDKRRLWNVNVTRGERQVLQTGLGPRDAMELVLTTTRAEPDQQQVEAAVFEGPFGIKGDLRLWFDEATGIPLLIAGRVPAGPVEIEVEIRLEAAAGVRGLRVVEATEKAE
ncbi:MAG: DUF3108 domain-containing protein [Planctomycetota bacterium]